MKKDASTTKVQHSSLRALVRSRTGKVMFSMLAILSLAVVVLILLLIFLKPSPGELNIPIMDGKLSKHEVSRDSRLT